MHTGISRIFIWLIPPFVFSSFKTFSDDWLFENCLPYLMFIDFLFRSGGDRCIQVVQLKFFRCLLFSVSPVWLNQFIFIVQRHTSIRKWEIERREYVIYGEGLIWIYCLAFSLYSLILLGSVILQIQKVFGSVCMRNLYKDLTWKTRPITIQHVRDCSKTPASRWRRNHPFTEAQVQIWNTFTKVQETQQKVCEVENCPHEIGHCIERGLTWAFDAVVVTTGSGINILPLNRILYIAFIKRESVPTGVLVEWGGLPSCTGTKFFSTQHYKT